MTTEERIQTFRQAYGALREEIGKVIVGHEAIVEGTLIALFAGGHVLLEGVPGLGKTLLVRTLNEVLDLSFNRIQFTPDLMPADILGTNIVMETGGGRREFQFQRGPIFAFFAPLQWSLRVYDRGGILRHSFEDLIDDVLGGDAFGFGFEIQNQPVPQRGGGNGLDVVEADVETALSQGADFASQNEGLAAARAAAEPEILTRDR